MQINTKLHDIFISGAEELNVSYSVSQRDDDLEIIKISINSDVKIHFPQMKIKWNYPIVDIHSFWYPTAFRNKKLDADWNGGFSSKATISAPVGCFYNIKGKNRMTFALSDALNTIQFGMGVHEEDATLNCTVTLFKESMKPMTNYEIELLIDTRDIPYYESLEYVANWWENFEMYEPTIVPEYAKIPMYSTWYSFHQQITAKEVEKQCSIAKDLGCEAVIVDDGWQTSDSNRGYAFCGDWEVCKERIFNMKDHVENIHNIGMKYLLWYSVPFVGINTKAWDMFKDKLLTFNEDLGTGVLDPRYNDVREYLITLYEKALIEWDLDGFKLDFVDEFYLREEDAKNVDKRRDYESVQEAVDRLLTDIIKRLRNIKPNIMIEFRQKYIGPLMRKYGNMFRAGDCPNDAITNRMETIDIRLLSGNTAVHSDMIMWNPYETVENAALQIINILFSVPQISVRFDQLPKNHLRMVKFWLSFWKEHRDVLLEGKFKPLYPELIYPVVESDTEDKKVIAIYSDFCVRLSENVKENIILVNGTLKNEVFAYLEENLGKRRIQIYNCCGDLIKDKIIILNKGAKMFSIPAAGVMILKNNSNVNKKTK